MNDLFKKDIGRLSRWDSYAYVLLSVAVLFQALVWQKMPLFMDCYYHLAVMRGFNDAGGWVGTAFWEYAPYGRPHLYPPLFHLLELALFKCGVTAITVARLFQFSIYPFFLFVSWRFLRRFFSQETAFFGLFLLFSSFALYLSIVILIPFTLALLLGLAAFYFSERSKWISASLSLALAFYAHHLMAWLLIFAFLLYAFLSRRNIRAYVLVCLAAILGAAPFLWHQIRYLSFVSTAHALEFYFAHVNVLLIGLALFGIPVAFRRGKQYLFLVALAVSMAMLLFIYRNRFLSGQGLVPLCFLSAIFLETAWQQLKTKRFVFRSVFFAGLTLIFYFFTPVLELSPLRAHPGSKLISRLPKEENYEKWADNVFQQEETFYHPRLVNDVVRLITENSKEGDILCPNFNYGGGMFSVLSHRATSDAMLSEVKPFVPFDEIKHARLVLWFKDPSGAFPAELPLLIKRYGLKKAGETDLAYLYLNEKAHFHSRVIPASVPFGACLGILFLVVLAVILENKS